MLNKMCLNCKCLENGCNGTHNQVWSGCIYKEKFENEQQEYLRRYTEVMKKINTITLLELPERVKQILQKTTDLKTKVLMLEEIASIL